MNANKTTNKNVDCFQCKYFAFTWEAKTPRACKFFGFKSAEMPSVTVYKTSGTVCDNFIRKDIKKEK